MSVDLSTITLTQAFWLIAIVFGAILLFIVVRFFFRHLLRFLVHGCLVTLLIAGLLFLLHYLKVF